MNAASRRVVPGLDDSVLSVMFHGPRVRLVRRDALGPLCDGLVATTRRARPLGAPDSTAGKTKTRVPRLGNARFVFRARGAQISLPLSTSQANEIEGPGVPSGFCGVSVTLICPYAKVR